MGRGRQLFLGLWCRKSLPLGEEELLQWQCRRHILRVNYENQFLVGKLFAFVVIVIPLLKNRDSIYNFLTGVNRVFVSVFCIRRPPCTCHGLWLWKWPFGSLWETNSFLAWLLEEQLSSYQHCHHNGLHCWPHQQICQGTRNVYHSYGHVPSNSALMHTMNWSPCHVPTYAMSFLPLSKSPKFPDCHCHTSNKQLIPLQREMALNQTPDVDYPPFWEVDRSVSERELKGCSWVYITSKLSFLGSNAPECWSARSIG